MHSSKPNTDLPGGRFVGTWLSLVEHSLGVRGVGSSNLPVPTILLFSPLSNAVDSAPVRAGS